MKRLGSLLDKMAADRPVLLAFLVFLSATCIVVPLSLHAYLKEPRSFFDNVLVEAHGMLFDLLIIGWFAMWMNKRAERRLRIRRYQEEIDDFLGWESQEAMHRITGSVRRLNRSGVTAIDLHEAFLQGAYLIKANLEGANLAGATMRGAKLQDARLKGASLFGAEAELADMMRVNLRDALLDHANLSGAYLEGADLSGATLRSANLKGTYFKQTNLRGADLDRASLKGAHLEHADLRGAVVTADQLGEARTLAGTRLDPALARTLQATHGHLFEAALGAARATPRDP